MKLIETKEPKIFIISGPGGAGKTTLVKRLFRKKIIKENFLKTISFTTRKKRLQEKNKKDYFFVSKEEFLKLKKKNFFLETQRVVDDYYGTPGYFYQRAKKEKKNLILCIDVKGAMYLKKRFKLGKIITIFVWAPLKELYERLKKRKEKEEVIKKRIALTKKELQFLKKYDYVIINQNIEITLKVLESILIAENFRIK
jgi:guanylate kinase